MTIWKILTLVLIATLPLAGADDEPTRPPNVLFIAVDDLNDWGGSLDKRHGAKTPHMDKLFASGTLFTNAHCSQPVCTASRNSLLSGIHPVRSGWYSSTERMKKNYEAVMADHQMLPEHFKDNGYRTLAVGKVYHNGSSDYKERRDDFWSDTGPSYKVPREMRARSGEYKGTKFYPFPKSGNAISKHFNTDGYVRGNSLCTGPLDRDDMPGGKMYDEIIADWAVDQLEKKHSKRPFFLAVGFVRPHLPFTAPREYFDLYDSSEIDIPEVPKNEMADIPMMGKSIAHGTLEGGDHHTVLSIGPNYWCDMVHGYLACISFVDAQIGKVVEALEGSGHADNTIIVLWSDHGQHLGEKRHWRKQALWEESTRVPLFFRTPGQSQAARCDSAVSLLDLYPTLVELCGLPAAPKAGGRSLMPLLEDPEAEWDHPVHISWYYKNDAVRSNRWRYIRYRDGGEELYDHQTDPGEHTNLAADPKFAPIIASHRQHIPENPALPAGSEKWEGDTLDRRIAGWKKDDSVPAWLE